MASVVAQAYNGGMGTVPPVGSRGRAPGQGAKPPEAEALLAFGHSTQAANLAIFLKFGNAGKLDICVIFAKIIDGNETGGEDGANWGPCSPQPGPKTAIASKIH